VRAVRTGVATILTLLAVGLAALILVPTLLGYQRYVITGGSMQGSIDRGSIVFDKPVPPADLKIGDVITYTPPAGGGPRTPVTHRIVWTGRDKDGRRAFRTKGDANPTSDPKTFTLDRKTQARVAAHVPYVGYAFAALSVRWLRMLVIGLPAVLIALGMLARLWREAGDELRRRQAELQGSAGVES
jgi:signal peptidase